MRIDAVYLQAMDLVAVYHDQQLTVVGDFDLSTLEKVAEMLGLEYDQHDVNGGLWEIVTDVPHLLGDALREGDLEAAQPVGEDLL